MLSEVANQLGRFITTQVSGNPRVVIGPPADAVPTDANAEPVINLFFYKVGPSGFHADATTQDPFYIRIQCLITAFGKDVSVDNSSSSVLSEGEITLRLLGSVIEKFHQNPVQHVALPDGGPLAQSTLQIVFAPLNIEELNQIWGTQGDIIFRTSLAYEIALAPMISDGMPPMPSRVGEISGHVGAIDSTPSSPTANPQPDISFTDNEGQSGWVAETWRRPNNNFITRFEGSGSMPQIGSPNLNIKIMLPPQLQAPHKLVLRQIAPSDQIVSETAISGTAQQTLQQTLSFPAINGDYLIYVDSQRADSDGLPISTRSNILSVKMISIPQPAGDGGGS